MKNYRMVLRENQPLERQKPYLLYYCFYILFLFLCKGISTIGWVASISIVSLTISTIVDTNQLPEEVEKVIADQTLDEKVVDMAIVTDAEMTTDMGSNTVKEKSMRVRKEPCWTHDYHMG